MAHCSCYWACSLVLRLWSLWALARHFTADSAISDSFRQFIRTRYGIRVANLLARDDLGSEGSYGGGNHVAGKKTNHYPVSANKQNGKIPLVLTNVIFVHGLMTSAGTTQTMASFFQSSGGYSDEELYATSFGPRGGLYLSGTMDCQYAQAIRYMIIAVSEFTDSPVVVIAYSFGVPISRKAILGGSCVEGGDLGRGSLTQLVDTFLGVAGPNNGIASCSLPLAYLQTACNTLNGLNCKSAFITDVNSRSHYEGQLVYAIQSTADFAVGTYVCGLQTAAISGANYLLTFEGLSHIQLCTLTAEQQFNLVTRHTVN